MAPRWSVALLALAGSHLTESLAATKVASPLSPEQALATFETEPDLKVSLVAAEPLIDSPCAMAFDEAGRLYVAENRGYPLGGTNGKPEGRIALLSDTDGDGRMDQRADFATGLSFPNGVLPWRGGVIVTCAPDVLFLKDTDGDGKADQREVVLTGFATNVTTQLRVNAPLLAPDGWVYLASGMSGGTITSPKRPKQPALELKGDLRFRPDTAEFEGIDGQSQFGQTFDDFGRRFGCFNRVQVQHFVLSSRHLARSPVPLATGVLQNCPELVENPLMRGGGGAARLYPISENITTADSHAGYFTAACAVHFFRGDGLPATYRGRVFSCDPTANLVHQDRLDAVGATFAARRGREGVEFLRSPDGWFRPVFLATGPDGTLYVADIYRQTIEHPEYLPAEVRKRTDFNAGKGRGRIWRAADASGNATHAASSAFPGTPEELIRELESSNGWRRDTAMRLLLEGNHRATAPLLREATARFRDTISMSVLLRLLDAMGALDSSTISAGLASKEAGVRETAIQLAEPRLAPAPELVTGVVRGLSDRDARVRFTAALVVGTWLASPVRDNAAPEPGIPATIDRRAPATSALASMAGRDAADPWARSAVMCSARGVERDLIRALLARSVPESDGLESLLADLGRALASGPSSDRAGMMLDLARGELSAGRAIGLFSGFGDGLVTGGAVEQVTNAPALVAAFKSNANAMDLLQALRPPAESIARNSRATPGARSRAINFLAYTLDDASRAGLFRHVRNEEPVEVQAAALKALTRGGAPAIAQELLTKDRWSAYLPGLRSRVLASVLERPSFHSAVLDSIQAGIVQAGTLPAPRRQQLLSSKDETIRARASKLLSSPAKAERQKAYDNARQSLSLKAVSANGLEVFKRACASCHRLDREGFGVGPDLFDVRNQPKETILLHIIIPEQEIAPNFTAYTCETRDGRTITGILVTDTPTAITLRQAQGVDEAIARKDIASLAASDVSFMPQELEKAMTRQELADLLAWLKGE